MKLDLHVHTIYSADGKVEPERYLKLARKLDLDGFAVTDHNEIKGAIKTYKLARDYKKLVIVRGVEISSKSGHILSYGITEPIPRGLSAEETIERVVDAGGIAVAAHPYRLASGLGVDVVKRCDFGIIETLNHRSTKRENARARNLAEYLGAGITGGSDAHNGWELGLAATQFSINASTEDEILSELSKKNTKAIGSSSTFGQGLKMYSKLMVHWLKRGFKRI